MSRAKVQPESAEMPSWFDPAEHSVSSGGIFETVTGVALDEDGEPRSLAVRRIRAEMPMILPAPAAQPEE